MKKLATILTIVLFFAAVTLSFFSGAHMRDKARKEEQAEQFDKHISIAIDTLEKKSLSVDGVSEAIASNIWVAHELCDNPEISAELSNMWNSLVYEKDTLVDQEDVLAVKLKDISKLGELRFNKGE